MSGLLNFTYSDAASKLYRSCIEAVSKLYRSCNHGGIDLTGIINDGYSFSVKYDLIFNTNLVFRNGLVQTILLCPK
ncbi:MAG: hypothetical protein JW982_09905 [Spirochaetes bacterium]|nr:hypothetical protein [Spirochaetota bacterium]